MVTVISSEKEVVDDIRMYGYSRDYRDEIGNKSFVIIWGWDI